MPVEAGHIQLLEYQKEVIPELNWMLEDLFCRYGVSIPYYILDFKFPDYQIKAEWPAPYSPEWLALYRPSLPPWPEWPALYSPNPFPTYDIQWPVLYGMPWPPMLWRGFPKWEWPEVQREELQWPEWEKGWLSHRYDDCQKELNKRDALLQLTGWLQIQQPNWFDETKFDWAPNFNGFNFGLDGGNWCNFGYDLPWLNELLGLLFDEADIPRWTMPDFSKDSIATLNDCIHLLYGALGPAVAPVAEFSADPTSGDTPLTVIFTDESTNTPTSWSWDFGDGDTSTDQNPEHEFTTGTYTISLTATNATGSDTETKVDYISVDWVTQSFNSVDITPNHIQRWGYMCLSEGAPYCSVGYANYISSPQYRTFTQRLNQSGGQDYGYAKRVAYNTLSTSNSPWADGCSGGALAVFADRLCLEFFTTNAYSGATTASVAIYVRDKYTWGIQSGNPILNLYKYDYGDEVDVDDWAGGELLDTQEITATGTYNFSISPNDVNVGGLTKFKLSLQQMDSAVNLGNCGGWGLEFTPTQVLTLTK